MLFFNKKKSTRIVSVGCRQELPNYFVNYLWTYLDTLTVSNKSLGNILYFDIILKNQQCTVKFHEEDAEYSDETSLDLFASNVFLPRTVMIKMKSGQQYMYLPTEDEVEKKS